MKTNQNLSLPTDVAEKLKDEANMSGLVTELLWEYYDIKPMPRCRDCGDRVSRNNPDAIVETMGGGTDARCPECLAKIPDRSGEADPIR